VSKAVGGLTSRAALIEYQGLSPDQDWCVVSLGVNDSAPDDGIPAQEFEENYRQLLEQLSTSKLLLWGPMYVNENAPAIRGRQNSIINERAAIVERLAEAHSAAYLSLMDLLDPTLHLEEDGLHLNAVAYDLLSTATLEVIDRQRTQAMVRQVRSATSKGEGAAGDASGLRRARGEDI